MVDIYVVTILVGLVRLGNLATIEVGPGAVFFAAVVVIAMFAAMAFDPRLIWDFWELEHDREGAAEQTACRASASSRRASEPGKRFILRSKTLGSLNIGSPVYYRNIQVGQVVSFEPDEDGVAVSIELFVAAPNDRLVLTNTRFWNASGIDFKLNATCSWSSTSKSSNSISPCWSRSSPSGSSSSGVTTRRYGKWRKT
jgi:hypothetical protein